MVTGVSRFRAHFAGHEHQYVLIGGAAIIPFKARAWLDLTRQRDAGGSVARLLQVLSPEASYSLPATVANDMRSFVEAATAEADYDPRQFNVNMTREEVADRLRAAYQL